MGTPIYTLISGAPFRDITRDGSVTTSISGASFDSYISALDAEMSAEGYSCTLDVSGSQPTVTVEKTGATDHTWTLSGSAAELLGWPTTTIGPGNVTTVPLGCVIATGFRFTSSKSRPVERRKYGRYGQRVSSSPDTEPRAESELSIWLHAADVDVFLDGPLSRAFQLGDQKYTVTELRSVTPLDDIEGGARIDVTVSPISGSPSLLQCGYTYAYYLRVEGLPYVFSESATLWTSCADDDVSDDYIESATLWIDESTIIEHSISRDRALMGISSMVIGINDPENNLELFGRPQNTAVLGADWDEDSTVITVDDTSGFLSSGTVYLGKECITYDALTNTEFRTLTRGDYNQLYRYSPSKGSAPFATVSDRPVLWRGRTCELWRYYVDPLGRAVGSEWDEYGNSEQVYLGQLDSVPRYVGGVWELQLSSLVSRLESKVGSEAEGQLSQRYESGIPIAVHVDDRILAKAYFGNGDEDSIEINPFADYHLEELASSAEHKVVYMHKLMSAICQTAWTLQDSGGNTAGGYFPALATKSEIVDGEVIVWIQASGFFGTFDDVVYYFQSYNLTQESPYWLGGWTLDVREQAEQFLATSFAFPLVSHPVVNSRMAIVQAPSPAQGGELPAAGSIVIESDETEVVSYSEALPADYYDEVYLCGLLRGLFSTRRANVYDEGTYATATEYTGTYSSQILTMLQTSGIGDRGDFDTGEEGTGYGLPDRYVAQIHPGIEYSGPTLVSGAKSFADVFGDLIRFFGYAIGVQRYHNRLVITTISRGGQGYLSTLYSGNGDPLDFSVAGSTLVRNTAPEQPVEADRANIVRVSTTEIPGVDDSPQISIIASDSVQARGGQEATYEIPMDAGGPLIAALAGTLILEAETSAGLVSLDVGSGLAHSVSVIGRPCQVNVVDSAIWDYADHHRVDSTSQLTGVVVKERRPLSGEAATLHVQVAGAVNSAGYCSHGIVISASGTTISLDPSDTTFIQKLSQLADDLPIRAYQSGTTNYADLTAVSINIGSGPVYQIDVDATVPAWLSAGGDHLYVTWSPESDYAAIATTVSGRNYAVADLQLDDGTEWS